MSIEQLDEDDLDSGLPQHAASDADEKQLEGQGGEQHEDELEEDDEPSAKRDKELDEAKDDEEREAIRERRRADRRNKNQRQKAKIEALERRLESVTQQYSELSQQLAGVHNATFSQSLAALEKEIAEAQRTIDYYSNMEVAAMQKQDGNTYKAARQKGDEFKARLWQLNALKSQATQSAQRPVQQPTNPEVTRRAMEFASKHSWYRGPQSTDDDSMVLSMLDAKLVKEGWNPASETYWQELESRLGKYLPHRAPSQSQTTQQQPQRDRQPQKSPVAGSSEGQPAQGKRTFRLSEERVKALKDAGMWNDPKKREKAIKGFQEYDRTHGHQ